jgi:hypothetical protein
LHCVQEEEALEVATTGLNPPCVSVEGPVAAENLGENSAVQWLQINISTTMFHVVWTSNMKALVALVFHVCMTPLDHLIQPEQQSMLKYNDIA